MISPSQSPKRRRCWWLSRLVLVLLCLTTLYWALRRVYSGMFHQPRIDAISRDLAEWFDGNGGDDDKVAKRTKILDLRRAMGIGADSLPTVRFAGGGLRPRRHRDPTEDEDEAEARIRQRECLTYGAYVSAENEYVDCRSYCNLTDGVEYRYYDRLGVFLNGRRGRVGGYCVPTDAAVCNTNTSLTVYSRDGWRCLPQTRAFAGEGGNRIVVCNGQLLDRASGKIWRGHIDPTLEFDSIDEKLPNSTDEYRFVCPPGLRDERDNLCVPAPFDRLFLLRNTCAKLIPHADDSVRPVLDDEESHRCECGKYAYYDERLRTCVPVAGADNPNDPQEFFDRGTMLCRLANVTESSACWEPWMTVSQARALSPADRLCGVEHKDAGHGATNVGYVRYRGAIFDRAVPSPTAMAMTVTAVP